MGDSFDVNFKLLMPDLQVKLWLLGLDANTSKVAIAYKTLNLNTGIGYNYGGNLEAFMAIQGVRTTLGVNPSNGNVDLGLVYKGFKFGSTASYVNKSAGLTFGYGADLVPFTTDLAPVFSNANSTAISLFRGLSNTSDPLAAIGIIKDDAPTIAKAVQSIQNLNKIDTKSHNFGVGLRLNYDPHSGFVIYGGAQWLF